MARVRANLASNVKKGRMTSQKADAIYSLCTPCLTYDKFKEADMVIEAVIENLDLKQKIFADLSEAADRTASSAPTPAPSTSPRWRPRCETRADPRRSLLLPAHVMQLFEIIRTDATPPQVLVDALDSPSRSRRRRPPSATAPGSPSTACSSRTPCRGPSSTSAWTCTPSTTRFAPLACPWARSDSAPRGPRRRRPRRTKLYRRFPP